MIITIQIEAANLNDAMYLLGQKAAHAVAAPAQETLAVAPVKETSVTPIEKAPVSQPAEEAPKTYLLTEVRAILADLRKAKGAAAAKALLEAQGVSSLSELAEDAYAAVVDAAKGAMR